MAETVTGDAVPTFTGIPAGECEQPPEVKVWWDDAKAYGNEWYSLEEVRGFELEACVTKGFLVHEDDKAYYVAQTVSLYGAHNIFLIPKSCVSRVDYV